MWVGKLVVAVVVALGALSTLSAPALAHTSLVRSEPADRTIAEKPPETLTLVFVNELDPRSVSVEVKAVDGRVIGQGERTTPDDPATATISFELPDLDSGTYGLAWQAVGDDGHRVAGETVIGVGDPADGALTAEVDQAGFSSSDPVDRFLELGAGLGRSFWYVGLSLLVGSSYLLWSRRRSGGAASRSEPELQLHLSASWWAHTGWVVAMAAAAAGWAIIVVSRYRYFDLDGSLAERSVDAVAALPAAGWAMAAVALACGHRALGRLRTLDSDRSRTRARMLTVVVVAAAFWSVLAGHAASPDAPSLDLVSLTAHLLAAALWVGPLAVLSLTAVTSGWRGSPSAERRRLLTDIFAGYANVAFAAFAVLVASGVYSAWVTLGGRWFENAYSWTLVGKLALVAAVVIPLAAHHDRVVRRSAASPAVSEVAVPVEAEREAVGTWSFLRSVRIEAVVLVVVLGLAALLGGLDPGFDASAQEVATGGASDLFADTAVNDASECAGREIGKPSCYREYFASVMVADGADVAVAEIADLAGTDEYVALDCHQITHDLGEDAVGYYGDLGQALSFDASACWSGYYHGAVETEMSGLDDQALLEIVPRVCNEAAEERYSFTHYNCVHGVGHGLMLRFDADLWTVIPYCETFPSEDIWERRSCLGGAFMQNIVSAQEGESASLRDDDLLYPCTELEGSYRQECLGMQTSWILWKLSYDYAAGFAACDGLEPDSRSTCYQSMGRDISGGSGKDVAKVVANCDLGDEAFRQSCIVGASLDAVYDDHGTARASELCEVVDTRWRRACEDARDSAASTF